MTEATNDKPVEADSALDWDQDFAEQLLGATLLSDVTYLAHDGTLVRREQVFGRIDAVDPDAGITLIRSDTGETFTLPPILEAIEPASHDSDRISDGEARIEDPDYTVIFSVTAPLRH